MNDNFKDRLNKALQIRGMSAAELARLSGVNEGAISRYKKGAYKASQENLDKLAKTLNVSIPWLMGANVPMDKQPSKNQSVITSDEEIALTPKEKDVISSFRQLNDEGQEKASSYIDDLVDTGKYKKYGSNNMVQKDA